MLTVSTPALELADVWIDSDPTARLRVTFPVNRWAGAADSGVVFFEIEPGNRLARHTDSAEEILYVVRGQAEAEVGGERGTIRAGDLAVIPAMVPHGLVNTGDETVTIVGFFSESEIHSTFAEPLQPIGATTVEQGAPAPAPAQASA